MYSPLYVRMRRDVACPHPLTVSHMCGHATSLRVRPLVSSCRTRNLIACPLSFHADTQSCCVSAMLQCGHAEKLCVRMKRQRTCNIIACPLCCSADALWYCMSALCTAYICGQARLLRIRSLFTCHTPHKIIQSVHALHNHYSYTSPKCKNLHRSRLSAPSRSPNHPSVSARPIPHLLQHSFSHTIVNSFLSDHNDINILTHPM